MLPSYLENVARKYFESLGCFDFRVIGRVHGAPNVMAIFDAIELADQEYETLLREEKSVELDLEKSSGFVARDILIFPGSFDLQAVCNVLPEVAQIHIDVAYDFAEPKILSKFRTRIRTIFISTSSDLFKPIGGVVLPWEERQRFGIYLAAPDFTYADRRAIQKALAALTYHNFNVRRPIAENRELPPNTPLSTLQQTYRADYDLLKQCSLVFAVPTGRDPGTLVEIGIAIEANVPVVVYDPARENANTMVIAGTDHYSADLDDSLNAVFRILSRVRAP